MLEMPYLRTLSVVLAAIAVPVPSPVEAGEVGLHTRDLKTDAQHARARRVPILLLFSADYCTYCVRLVEEFLSPMQRSGEYDTRVLIREVKIDDYGFVRDFSGNRVLVLRNWTTGTTSASCRPFCYWTPKAKSSQNASWDLESWSFSAFTWTTRSLSLWRSLGNRNLRNDRV